MKRWTLLLLAALTAGCGAEGNRPGYVVLPGMDASIPYDAYDPNPVTRNGGTLLMPPEGTVPVGFAPFLYGKDPGEAERAGRELQNPLAATPENLRRGEREFTNKCQVCHGPKGDGDGPIIGLFPNPPNLHAERARTLPDGHIYHIISRGQGIMPSHAAQVLPDDRWRVILHLRKLQGQLGQVIPAPEPPRDETAPAPADELAPSEEGSTL